MNPLHVSVESGAVEVDLGVRIVSEMNDRSHWRARYKRFKEQKEAVFYALANFRPLLKIMTDGGGQIVVTFTHCGPKAFDSDGLSAGFKAARDQAAAILGIDDGLSRIDWKYEQDRSRTYGARVKVEVAE